MRILVCGDRNWTDRILIGRIIKEEFSYRPKSIEAVVIHGKARGADTIAGEIAWALGLGVIEFPADWDNPKYRTKTGKSFAGNIRNQQMLDEGRPDKVVAFHDDIEHSKGTKDMVARSRKANIEVRVVSHNASSK